MRASMRAWIVIMFWCIHVNVSACVNRASVLRTMGYLVATPSRHYCGTFVVDLQYQEPMNPVGSCAPDNTYIAITQLPRIRAH